MNGFLYVDGYYKTPKGRGKKWIRVKQSEIKSRIVDPAKNYDCYCTIQRFANPAPVDEENQLCGLFFDLDDSKNPDHAQSEAVKIVDFFVCNYELAQEEIRVFFSGKKGFHILIDERVFAIKPSPHLTYVHKLAAYWLQDYLGLKTVDMSAYSIRRQWRLADSVHPTSSLYKIELTLTELKTKTLDEIKILAKQPRGDLYDEQTLAEIGARPEAVEWYGKFVQLFEEHERERKLAPSKPIKQIKGEYPVCVKDLLKNHIRKQDTRNRATMTLASFFKDVGVEQKEAEKIISEWIEEVPQKFSDHAGDVRFLRASVPPVVKTVYEDTGYHFLCSFIRSLGTDEEPIKCIYDDCPFTSPEDQEPETPVEVHLAESSRVEFFGKKLSVRCIVSGKWDSPLVIPKKVRVSCTPNLKRKNSKCRGCKMAATGGKFEKTFTTKTNEFLNFIQCNEYNQMVALRRACGMPGDCDLTGMEVLEQANVEEVQVIPQIENSLTDKEYVRRKGYFIGHGLKSNENYVLKGYSQADPRTQYVVYTFSEFDSAASSLSEFQMTEALGKELMIFRPKPGQLVEEKFKEIHKDLETNVTRVWGRLSLAIAFDMVYHSVLSFRFLGKFVRKGWTECLILGDSGQAKSTIAERLMEHYDLGHKISGEGASRTGLAYSITSTGDKWFVTWGALPLNDRRLVVIDEFSGIDAEEVALLSELRSTGIAEVRKVISAKANARTRLIMMSNSRDGFPLNTLTYPVTAILGLIPKAEDVRRLDFALGVMSGEVPSSLINRHPDEIEQIEHVFTSYYCKKLILWVWTRTPDQVVFTREAEKKVLEVASAMGFRYSPKIPLVEPADQRMKVARLAVAVAARMFSSSEDFQSVVVLPQHVEFVEGYLQTIYSAPSMAYEQFSQKNRPVIVDVDKYNNLADKFRLFPDWQVMAEFILDGIYFTTKKLQEIMGYEKERLGEVTKFLAREGIVRGTTRGYRVSEMGIDFLKRVLNIPVEGSETKETPF